MKPSPLQAHQVSGVDFMLANPYSIMAADPGLGKSRMLIEVREKLKNNCLVICPSYLVPNWVKEIKKWTPNSLIRSFKRGKDMREVVDADYIIVSYDLAQKAPYLFEWADMVGIDEAHALKSMKAKRSQFIHQHVYENSIARLHLLTGTPIKNRVQEFYSLLALTFYNPHTADSRFLDLYPSEIDFADKFSYREEYTLEINNRFVPIVKWSGLRNKEELKQWLDGRYMRIKSDVIDLPPIVYNDILISDSPDPALLGAFKQFFQSEGSDSVKPDKKREAAEQKVPFTIKFVEDLLEQKECCVVYSDHIAPAIEIANHFGTRAICGDMPASMRSRMADAFQAGEGRVLVATIGALKEGKDLFRSSDIVFNDIPWVPGDLKQVIKRIHRMGQEKTCTVHKILGSPQDEYISTVIEDKIKTIEEAT